MKNRYGRRRSDRIYGRKTDGRNRNTDGAQPYMSNYLAWESMTIGEFQPILTKLRLLLDNLPTQLPSRSGAESIYYAIFFNSGLDPVAPD